MNLVSESQSRTSPRETYPNERRFHSSSNRGKWQENEITQHTAGGMLKRSYIIIISKGRFDFGKVISHHTKFMRSI